MSLGEIQTLLLNCRDGFFPSWHGSLLRSPGKPCDAGESFARDFCRGGSSAGAVGCEEPVQVHVYPVLSASLAQRGHRAALKVGKCHTYHVSVGIFVACVGSSLFGED